MDTQLASTVLRINDLIDDFIDLQEAQQVIFRQITDELKVYKDDLDAGRQRMLKAIDSVSILSVDSKGELKDLIRKTLNESV